MQERFKLMEDIFRLQIVTAAPTLPIVEKKESDHGVAE